MSNNTPDKGIPIVTEEQMDTKPYINWKCQGRYMEPGQEWSGKPCYCSSVCDLRLLCWAQTNGKTLDENIKQES